MANFDYKYGIRIFGENYAPADLEEPSHVFFATSLEDAKHRLEDARSARNPYGYTGDGERTLDTPGYGREGDGAYIYPVTADYADIIDEPRERAIEAFMFIEEIPSHLATFGARGGIKVERI